MSSASALPALADWIEAQLSDEPAGRQEIAESAASRIRGITRKMAAAEQAAARATLTEVRPAPLLWAMTIRQALLDAIRYREDWNTHPDNPEQVSLYKAAAQRRRHAAPAPALGADPRRRGRSQHAHADGLLRAHVSGLAGPLRQGLGGSTGPLAAGA